MDAALPWLDVRHALRCFDDAWDACAVKSEQRCNPLPTIDIDYLSIYIYICLYMIIYKKEEKAFKDISNTQNVVLWVG